MLPIYSTNADTIENSPFLIHADYGCKANCSLTQQLLFLNGFCVTLRAFQKSQNQKHEAGKTGVSLVFVSNVLFQKRVVA